MADATEFDQYVAIGVDINDHDNVLIVGDGEWREFEDRETKKIRKKLSVPIKCAGGQVKDLLLNDSSRKEIIAKYGKDTSTWIDRQLLIRIVTKDVFGQLKEVIYANPVV